MKNFSIFLFVFSLCMFDHVSSSGFKITNELKSNKLLRIGCYSKDDIFGPKTIPIGQHVEINFTINFWHTTRFMSYKVSGFMVEEGIWDWRAREDGIYLDKENGKHIGKSINLHKMYDWLNYV
ncbi:putative plant self-incompatibility S1 [Arabidopsis thaliana]